MKKPKKLTVEYLRFLLETDVPLEEILNQYPTLKVQTLQKMVRLILEEKIAKGHEVLELGKLITKSKSKSEIIN